MAASSLASADPGPFVLLVEDEVLVRATLTRMLERGGVRVVSAASADEAIEVLGAGLAIKAVVTDVNLVGSSMDGFALAWEAHNKYQIAAVVMSGHASPEHGELPPEAHFLAKPVHKDTLVHLVRDLVGSQAEPLPAGADEASEPQAEWLLTPRQHEVLALLVQGKSNQDIAEAMGLSPNTVKVHLAAIFRVLGVSSRTEALVVGLKRLSAG